MANGVEYSHVQTTNRLPSNLAMSEQNELRERIRSIVPLSSVTGSTSARIPCPFHNSKDPDMVLLHGDHSFRCWGGSCGVAGDVVTWVQLERGLALPDAMKVLCDEYNISWRIPDKRIDILTRATEYFHRRLFLPEGAKALQYLRSRRVSIETIMLHKIGLCDRMPVTVTEEEAREVGLINRVKSGNDWFVLGDRITFPVRNRFNEIVHMQGRFYMPGQDGPKYMALPKLPSDASDRTPYPITHHLFNEQVLFDRIVEKSDELYLFEGVPDCLSASQWNLPAVAVFGNRDLHKHAYKFKKLKRLFICMDADPQTRTNILYEISELQQKCPKLNIFDVVIEGAKDLNEFYLNGGAKGAFLEMCERSMMPFGDRIIMDWAPRLEMHQPLLYTIAAMENASDYVQKLAAALNVGEETITFTMRLLRRTSESKNLQRT